MTRAMTRGVTIRVFLDDGTPEGLRLVERMGWTGSFLTFARADYAGARVRDEDLRTGVSVLVGPDPDGLRNRPFKPPWERSALLGFARFWSRSTTPTEKATGFNSSRPSPRLAHDRARYELRSPASLRRTTIGASRRRPPRVTSGTSSSCSPSLAQTPCSRRCGRSTSTARPTPRGS